jgi:two-component system OmpR family response regulator
MTTEHRKEQQTMKSKGPTPLSCLSTGKTASGPRTFELDLIERTARRSDRTIDLLPREFRLLQYMMRREEQLLTHAMLLEEVWHHKFVPQTNLVDVHMGRLRRKVDEQRELPMIHNARGVGFILRAPARFAGRSTERAARRPTR